MATSKKSRDLIARGSRSTWVPIESTAKNIGAILRSRELCPVRPDSEPLIGGSILVLHGDEHFARRRLEATLFTSSSLRDYEVRLLVPAIDDALMQLRVSHGRSGEVVRVDLVPLIRGILLHVASELIGLDISTGESWHRINGYLDKLIDGSTLEWSTRDFQDARAEALEYKQFFAEHFVTPATQRRSDLVAKWRAGELAETDLPRDLITLLLRSPHEFDVEMILRECTLYLVASTQTTSNATTHAVAELDTWFAAHPEDVSLQLNSQFLRQAGMEALRLHPSSPSIVRLALTDVTLPSGEHVSAGQIVAPNVVAANQDPALFGGDADRFNPHRKTDHHLYGYAFGSGPHVCIGQPLVLGMRTSEQEGGEEVDGIFVRILKALYRSGIRRDFDRAAVRASSGQDRYASFPVLLTP